MNTYLASDLFELKVCGNSPLNCEFIAKKPIPIDLVSPGVYMMFYKDEIIYVGTADKQKPIVRFEKQLSTITLRGKSISFNDECRNVIQSSNSLSSRFPHINQNNFGFETSIKKIAFSNKNWDSFSQLNNDILGLFVFVWFPKNECQDKEFNDIKNQWIKKIKPICNT